MLGTQVYLIVSVLCVMIPFLIAVTVLAMYIVDKKKKEKRVKEAAAQLEAGVMTENGVTKKIEAAIAVPAPVVTPALTQLASEHTPTVTNVPVSEYLNPDAVNDTQAATFIVKETK